MNPYENARRALPRPARRAASRRILRRLERLHRPDDLLDLDEHHFTLAIDGLGTLELLCVSRMVAAAPSSDRDMVVRRVSDVSVAVRRGFPDGREVVTAPTWFEVVLVRSLVWPDDALVVAELRPPAELEGLNPDAVHLRGPYAGGGDADR